MSLTVGYPILILSGQRVIQCTKGDILQHVVVQGNCMRHCRMFHCAVGSVHNQPALIICSDASNNTKNTRAVLQL